MPLDAGNFYGVEVARTQPNPNCQRPTFEQPALSPRGKRLRNEKIDDFPLPLREHQLLGNDTSCRQHTSLSRDNRLSGIVQQKPMRPPDPAIPILLPIGLSTADRVDMITPRNSKLQ